MERIANGRVPNTLNLPCEAKQIIRVDDADAVCRALHDTANRDLRLLPLGEGSNVVLPVQLDRAVLYSSDDSLTVIEEAASHVVLRVGAAHGWHDLVVSSIGRGYFGLENLALIPGLVGAAPVQNIGAYGRELSEFVNAVHGVDLVTGEYRRLDGEACEFAYRHSIFKAALRDRFMITSVEMRLSTVPDMNLEYPALRGELADSPHSPMPRDVMQAVVRLRQRRLPDPGKTPNAGSFFKNPELSQFQVEKLQAKYPKLPTFPLADGKVKVPAAWLIESSGLRGHRRGNAGMSDRHALVLINHGYAVQADVLDLAQHVRETVLGRFGIELEMEPRVYG